MNEHPAARESDTSINAMRREYEKEALLESDASPDPIAQFGQWFADATASEREPNAMALATCDASGRPSSRIVLLKSFDANGFVFYTNYDSRKGRDLAANPRACANFFWPTLERQVRVEGAVERVDRATSEVYFHSRPRASQLGAWVSQQSSTITSRESLEKLLAELETKYANQVIPLPEFWGGYRVIPQSIEFWQGRRSRLHDRLLYTKQSEGSWTISRLSP